MRNSAESVTPKHSLSSLLVRLDLPNTFGDFFLDQFEEMFKKD